MVYLPLGMRRRSWCITNSFSLRHLFWWPIIYVCKLKKLSLPNLNSSVTVKVYRPICSLVYSWKRNSQPRCKCWLISSRRNREKTLNFPFRESNKVFCLFLKVKLSSFYIHKFAFCLLTIKQTQLYILLTVFILEIPIL